MLYGLEAMVLRLQAELWEGATSEARVVELTARFAIADWIRGSSTICIEMREYPQNGTMEYQVTHDLESARYSVCGLYSHGMTYLRILACKRS